MLISRACARAGGRILLKNTTLHLFRGRRYGLCGANGAGKSTLMRSIAAGQLDVRACPSVSRDLVQCCCAKTLPCLLTKLLLVCVALWNGLLMCSSHCQAVPALLSLLVQEKAYTRNGVAVQGFPPRDVLRTVYVEHDIDASEAKTPVVDFVFSDKALQGARALPAAILHRTGGFQTRKARGGDTMLCCARPYPTLTPASCARSGQPAAAAAGGGCVGQRGL